MDEPGDPEGSDYRETQYLQFSPGGPMLWIQTLLGILSWPLVWPLAKLCRLSDILFRSASELLALIPYFPGVILRREFYRFALDRCGKNVLIELGTVFIYPRVEIGHDVLIGRYNIIHHCDIGSYVLIGERCTFLSGSKQHRMDRLDVPMALQGGLKRRISVADDCWIGSHSVIMDDIGQGSVIGAGSVVGRAIPEYVIAAGNPAKVIRERRERAADT
jgi:acetyltransferase-like isoleucine patch superfamily enzyme